MQFWRGALLICLAQLFSIVFSVLRVQAAPSAAVLRQRLFLTFPSDTDSLLSTPSEDEFLSAQCLIRQNTFLVQHVDVAPCASLPLSGTLRGIWIWYPDGRIRGTNGFCLTYIPNADANQNVTANPPYSELVAQRCTQRASDMYELWDIQDDRLTNAALQVEKHPHERQEVPPRDKLSQSPIWKRQKLHIQFFDPVRLRQLHQRFAHQELKKTQDDFRQLMRRIPDVTKDLAELTASLDASNKEKEELGKVLQEIAHVTQSIQMDLEGNPTHIGQGVAVEVMESAASSKPAVTFVSPKFELLTDRLRSVGVSPSGPVTVRISGHVIAPKDALYTFVVTDLSSQFKLSVNGVTLINQWAAPALGVVKSQPPLNLHAGDPVQLVASTSGILGTPNFKLKWQIGTDSPPTEIPTEDLFPSILEPLCTTGGLVPKIDCRMTFSKLQIGSDVMKVECPAGCLRQTSHIPVFGEPGCYARHSSVCLAAIHSGVLSERGGSILIQESPDMDRSQYKSTKGFLIDSMDAPAAKGCASVAMPILEGGPVALRNPKVVSLEELTSSSIGTGLSGITGFPSGLEKFIVTRRELGSGVLSDATISCGATGYAVDKKNFESNLSFGNDIKILFQKRAAPDLELPLLTAVFVAPDASTTEPLGAADGWNRLTCQTSEQTVALYLKFEKATREVEFPSATLSCESTFISLPSPLLSATYRCPRFCSKSFAPVFGTFTYSARSSVCRAAFHAGVISEAGGAIQVIRLPTKTTVTWSSMRNGIQSEKDDTPSILYGVDIPYGRKCIYPEYPPGKVLHMPLTSPKFEPEETPTVSFRQTIREHGKLTTQRQSQKMQNQGRLQFNHLPDMFKISSWDDPEVSAAKNIKAALVNVSEADLTTAMDLEAKRASTVRIQSLINQKIQETEDVIHRLELELVTIAPSNPVPYSDYDKVDSIHDHWLILDAKDASLGPSAWSLVPPNQASNAATCIAQASPIVSTHSLGTTLILRKEKGGGTYTAGFLTMTIHISPTTYGNFGVLVHYINDQNFIAIQLTKPRSSGPQDASKGSIGFRRMRNGKAFPLENSTPIEFAYGAASYLLAVDFGEHTVRAFVDKGEVKTGLNLEDESREETHQSPHGSVGLFTNAMNPGGSIMFESIIAGPLSQQEALAPKGAFGTDHERTSEVEVVKIWGVRNPSPAPSKTEEPTVVTQRSLASTGESLSISQPSQLLPASQCLPSYFESFSQGINTASGPWVRSLTEEAISVNADGSWFPSPGWATPKYITGERSSTTPDNSQPQQSPSKRSTSPFTALYLASPVCFTANGLHTRVTIRSQHFGTKSGLLLRVTDPANFVSVVLDMSTETGPQVVLHQTSTNAETEYSTGQLDHLSPGKWYQLDVEDSGRFVRVLLDRSVVLQTDVPNAALDTRFFRQGLAVWEGDAQFRDFQVEKLQ